MLAVLLCLIVIALIAEIVLRVVRGVPDNPLALIAQENLSQGYSLCQPNYSFTSRSSVDGEFEYTFTTNQYGYRGPEFPFEKPAGTIRIMAVGDSYTFGVGAQDDETYSALLQQSLRQQGYPVEVINAGVGHASTVRHWDNLLRFHLKYNPDIVVLFFDLTDMGDDWSWERHAVWNEDGTINRFDLDYEWGKRRWWPTLVHHSSLCKYLEDKVVRTFKKLRLLGLKRYLKTKASGERAKAVIINSDGEFSDDVMMEYDGLILMRGQKRKALIDKHWKRTEKYLLKIRDLLSERNIKFMIVMYPHGIYVGPDQWNEGRKTWGFEQGKQYTDYYPFELMANFTKRAGIPFLNTLPGFLSAPPARYFFDWDGHMTPAGNKIVVDQILKDPQFRKLLTR